LTPYILFMTNSGAHIVLSLLIKGKLSITKSDAFAMKKNILQKDPRAQALQETKENPHPKL
jgi:hypothetical protein